MFKSTLSSSVDEGFTVGIGACVCMCAHKRLCVRGNLAPCICCNQLGDITAQSELMPTSPA